jgi:hypothetical protein
MSQSNGRPSGGAGGLDPLSRGRLVGMGVVALVVCAAVTAGAVWLLITPQSPAPEASASPTSTAAASTAGDPDSGAAAPTLSPSPEIVPPGEAAGDGVVAQEWLRVLLGWTPEERDTTGVRERAGLLAPGAELEVLVWPVLDHAAALAASAPSANGVEVVEVTDSAVWSQGWVVLEATVTTQGAPEAGVSALVLHVTCEVHVAGGQVVAVLIGDGAAWIEYPS